VFSRRPPLAPLLILLSILSLAGPAFADTAPTRALFRVVPPRGPKADFFKLGLDVAGTGPRGTLDLILDAQEVATLRAMGLDPVEISLPGRGPLGAAESPAFKPDLGAYHTYAEAHTEMAAYVAAHPAIALLDTIGFSVQGRAIEAIKISDNVAAQESEPEVLLVGCHHARELMSVEIPLYAMRRLLDGYGTDPVLTSLVDTRQIWIVPVFNPDGYVYVEQNNGGQSDTWWRKNRRANADGSFGVDLNRNYGYNWGLDDVGSSPTPSSEVYRGTGPFSEPEVAAMRDFMAAHAFRTSISFHSYGDQVLYPWGYDALNTPDHPVFQALGDSMAVMNGYDAGNVASGTIYITNGDLDDWAYGDDVTKPREFGFTFEVNSAADGGFVPAETLIGPTCDLNWGPIVTLLRYGDEPRRILPPARPSQPVATFVPSPASYRLAWSYPAPDPTNPPIRHDVRRIGVLTRTTDDAESGFGDWDTLLFSSSTVRHASGTHSFWSGSGDNRTSVLTSRVTADVLPGDSVAVMAYWDLENGRDYWYAEASSDGGVTWRTLPGDHTVNTNPFGLNLGNGVTASSFGFQRAAFSLNFFGNTDVLIRFRCLTDPATHGEGLYLDDLYPVIRESQVSVTNTLSADTSWLFLEHPPGVIYFQVRGVDAEGHAGRYSRRLPFDGNVSGVAENTAPSTGRDLLGPVAPNPFNPAMTVRFALGRGVPGPYRLDVFDLQGRRVATLASGVDEGAGAALASGWDGRTDSGNAAGSGVYLFRLTTSRGAITRKATLLR